MTNGFELGAVRQQKSSPQKRVNQPVPVDYLTMPEINHG
jgi:hypothetical protein